MKEKDAPCYFSLIREPIDLAIIKGKCKKGEYQGTEHLMEDLELLRANAVQYNGIEHFVSLKANELRQLAR